MEDLITFRRMVTPTLIQIAFWIGLVGSILLGLTLLFGQRNPAGLLVLLIGPLVVRLYCELAIVLFRINDTLTDIYQSGRLAPATSSTYAAPPRNPTTPPDAAVATSPQMPLSRIPDRPPRRSELNDYW